MDPTSYKLSFKEKLRQELEDPFDMEYVTDAVTLVPCGHNINIVTVEKIKNLCPICRTPFEKTVPNTNMRNLAKIVSEEITTPDHTEAAEMLFENAKSLHKNNKITEAIELISEVLSISPDYKEAIGYNECLLVMLEMQQMTKPVVNNKHLGNSKEELTILIRELKSYQLRRSNNHQFSFINLLSNVITCLESIDKLNERQREIYKRFQGKFLNGNGIERQNFLEDLLISLSK